jgi:hypothetical protein
VVRHGGVGIDPLRVGHCTVAAVAAQHILCGDGRDEFGLRRWGVGVVNAGAQRACTRTIVPCIRPLCPRCLGCTGSE